MQDQTNLYLELYRTSLKTMNDAMKASLENAQRLQAQQLQLMEMWSSLWQPQKWQGPGQGQGQARGQAQDAPSSSRDPNTVLREAAANQESQNRRGQGEHARRAG
jgi:hypothetical protein